MEKLQNDIPATIDLNPPGVDATASVIWLHGLGADGNDFVPMVEELALPLNIKTRFVFPHAPILPITINGGMRMRAWYDIAEMNLSARQDKSGIENSERLIRLLIEREENLGISSDRIVLAGFSQGGAMSLYTGLRYPKRLAGIVALSSYLPLANNLATERDKENQLTPIFMAHGLFDPIVPLLLGEMTRKQLLDLGYTVEWHSYSIPHSVILPEIKDIGLYITKVLTS